VRLVQAAGSALLLAAVVAPPLAPQSATPVLVPVVLPTPLRTFDFRTGSIAWLSDSTVALVDMSASQVVIADLRHGTTTRHGREGSGPGEFRMPMYSVADAAGGHVLDDIGARRLTQFDARHSFVRQARSPGPTLRIVGWRGDTVRVVWVMFQPGSSPTVSDVNLATGDITTRYRLFDRDSTIIPPALDEPGGPALVAIGADGHGGLVAGSPRTYRLAAFDSAGRSVRRFGRPGLKAAFRTEAELDEEIRQMQGQMPPDALRDARARLAKQPKPFFSLAGVEVDGAGRVWVATTRGGMATDVDVFAADGRFIGTVSMAGHVTTLAFRLPWVAVLTERQKGEDQGAFGLDLYRIR
jgi:hypothetical protein